MKSFVFFLFFTVCRIGSSFVLKQTWSFRPALVSNPDSAPILFLEHGGLVDVSKTVLFVSALASGTDVGDLRSNIAVFLHNSTHIGTHRFPSNTTVAFSLSIYVAEFTEGVSVLHGKYHPDLPLTVDDSSHPFGKTFVLNQMVTSNPSFAYLNGLFLSGPSNTKLLPFMPVPTDKSVFLYFQIVTCDSCTVQFFDHVPIDEVPNNRVVLPENVDPDHSFILLGTALDASPSELMGAFGATAYIDSLGSFNVLRSANGQVFSDSTASFGFVTIVTSPDIWVTHRLPQLAPVTLITGYPDLPANADFSVAFNSHYSVSMGYTDSIEDNVAHLARTRVRTFVNSDNDERTVLWVDRSAFDAQTFTVGSVQLVEFLSIDNSTSAHDVTTTTSPGTSSNALTIDATSNAATSSEWSPSSTQNEPTWTNSRTTSMTSAGVSSTSAISQTLSATELSTMRTSTRREATTANDQWRDIQLILITVGVCALVMSVGAILKPWLRRRKRRRRQRLREEHAARKAAVMQVSMATAASPRSSRRSGRSRHASTSADHSTARTSARRSSYKRTQRASRTSIRPQYEMANFGVEPSSSDVYAKFGVANSSAGGAYVPVAFSDTAPPPNYGELCLREENRAYSFISIDKNRIESI